MLVTKADIDVSENNLRDHGKVLELLLADKTTNKNILWSTDSYKHLGKEFQANKEIKASLITGLNGKRIQPRASKSREEQIFRTKIKAEVFTPLEIVEKMNLAVDSNSKNFPVNKKNWIDYISELRLEISCGEGPFITSRYDPTLNTGKLINPNKRVGFFDNKLKTINRFVQTKKDWFDYVELALKSSYGFEWQGDNLLIARENLLHTVDDFYKLKFNQKAGIPTQTLEHYSGIISWNLFQMDGVKLVIPMSCRNQVQHVAGELTLFGETPPRKKITACEGCVNDNVNLHNGKRVKIMDWKTKEPIYFVDLISLNPAKKSASSTSG